MIKIKQGKFIPLILSFLAAAVFTVMPAVAGEWVEIPPIEQGIGTVYDMTVSDLTGTEHLYISTQWDLKVYDWHGSSWAINQTISLGESAYTIAAGDARNDGAKRLYMGTSKGNILEFFYTGQQWQKREAYSFSEPVNSLVIEKGISGNQNFIYAATDDGAVWEMSYAANTWQAEKIGAAGLPVTSIAAGQDSIYAVSRDQWIYRFQYDGAWEKSKLAKTYGQLETVTTFVSKEDIEYVCAVGQDSNIYYLARKDGQWHSFEIYPGAGSLYSIAYTSASEDEKIIAAGSNGNIITYNLKERKLNETGRITLSGTLYTAGYDEISGMILAGGTNGLLGAEYSDDPPPDLSHSPDKNRSPLFPFADEAVEVAAYSSTKPSAATLYYSTSSVYSSVSMESGKEGVFKGTIPSFSAVTVVKYYFKFEYSDYNDTYLYSATDYESGAISDTDGYRRSLSSELALSSPFRYSTGGTGQAAHIPVETMRVPVYPSDGSEVTFYVRNLAHGEPEDNYGDMDGRSIHYKENGIWMSEYLSWDRDVDNYKYWKASLTSNDYSSLKYYFEVTYGDHRKTYLYGNEYKSFTSSSSEIASAGAFEFTNDYAVVSGSAVTQNSGDPLSGGAISAYVPGKFEDVFTTSVSLEGKYSMRLPTGTYDIYASSRGYVTKKRQITLTAGGGDADFELEVASLPRSREITGNILEDFHSRELVSYDSMSDSSWGIYNEVGSFYVSWSSDTLYLGIEGRLDNNSVVVYMDVGQGYYGDIENAAGLDEWRKRNLYFPEGFRPDYQWEIWDFDGVDLYRINSSSLTEYITGSVENNTFNGGHRKHSSAVLAIPFNVLYEGYVESGLPAGATVQFIACMTGGGGSGAHDTNPPQGNSFGSDWDDAFTFDSYITVPLDTDGDNEADTNQQRGWPEKDYSPPAQPYSLTAETQSTSTVKLSWQGFIPEDFKGYEIFKSTAEGDYDLDSPADDSGTDRNINIDGLQPLVTYYFAVRSYDENDNYSPLSDETSAIIEYTPQITHTPVTEFNYIGRKMVISSEFGGVRPLTEKKLYYRSSRSDSFRSEPFSSGKAVISSEHTAGDFVEYFIFAENDLDKTAFAGSAVTPYRVTVNSEKTEEVGPGAASGMKFSASGEDNGSAAVEFEEGALSRQVDITLSWSQLWENFNDEQWQLPPGNSEINEVYPAALYELDIEPEIEITGKVYLTFRYFDEDITDLGLIEDDLVIYRLSPGGWEGIESTVDTSKKTVSAEVGYTGKFAVFESSFQPLEANGLAKIENPTFIPAAPSQKLRKLRFVFSGGTPPSDTSIKIFNYSGEMVRELKDGRTEWIGTDSRGEKVPGGVYVYQIEYEGETITGSCLLVR